MFGGGSLWEYCRDKNKKEDAFSSILPLVQNLLQQLTSLRAEPVLLHQEQVLRQELPVLLHQEPEPVLPREREPVLPQEQGPELRCLLRRAVQVLLLPSSGNR